MCVCMVSCVCAWLVACGGKGANTHATMRAPQRQDLMVVYRSIRRDRRHRSGVLFIMHVVCIIAYMSVTGQGFWSKNLLECPSFDGIDIVVEFFVHCNFGV